jgi:hypothetical protein
MKIHLFIAFIFLIASCKTTKEVSELTEDDIKLVLKKGSCFGECPVYTFNVYEGGYCEFIGKMNTNKIGTHSRQLEKGEYKTLIKEFKDSDFSTYKDMYESNIADLPLITMSYVEDGIMKTIKGKRERPEALHRLQFKLEKIAESKDGWVLLNEEVKEESKGPKFNKSQIVLELKHGSQLSRWFNDMRLQHGIRILKSLDDNEGKWLVSYNMNNYSPEDMIGILRNDPNVISADFALIEESK